MLSLSPLDLTGQTDKSEVRLRLATVPGGQNQLLTRPNKLFGDKGETNIILIYSILLLETKRLMVKYRTKTKK